MGEVRNDRQYSASYEWILDSGNEVSFEDEFCVVESMKVAGSVYVPADLEVVAENEVLDGELELLNTGCSDNGCLVKFKSDVIDGLMRTQSYTVTLD